MPKIGPEVRAARRGQFVSAARAPAAETEFRTLTIDDVCARAGLSKGAFYLHFSSKQGLLHAMLDAEVDLLFAQLAAGDLSELEQARGFVRTMVQRARDPCCCTSLTTRPDSGGRTWRRSSTSCSTTCG